MVRFADASSTAPITAVMPCRRLGTVQQQASHPEHDNLPRVPNPREVCRDKRFTYWLNPSLSFFLLSLLYAFVAEAASGPFVVQAWDGAGEGRPPLANAYIQLSGRFIATDAEGRAVFEGLPAGRYTLSVREPGFAALGGPVEVPAGQREPLDTTLRRVTPAALEGLVLAEGLGEDTRITILGHVQRGIGDLARV